MPGYAIDENDEDGQSNLPSLTGGNSDLFRAQAQALQDQANEKLKRAYSPEAPSGFGQKAGEAALTFLPILAGYLADGYRGGAAGAKAGQEGEKQFTKSQDDADALSRQFDLVSAKSDTTQAQGLEKGALSLDLQNAKQDVEAKAYAPGGYKYEYQTKLRDMDLEKHRQMKKIDSDAKSELSTAVTDEDVNDLSDMTGQDPERIRRMVSKPKEAFNQEQTVLKNLGGNLSKATSQQTSKMDAALDLTNHLDRMQELLGEMGNDPSVQMALKAGKINQLAQDPKSPVYKFYAELEPAKVQMAKLDVNQRLTSDMVEHFNALTVGSPAWNDKQVLQDRVNAIRHYADGRISNVIHVAKANRVNTSGIESLFSTQLGRDKASKASPDYTASGPGVSPSMSAPDPSQYDLSDPQQKQSYVEALTQSKLAALKAGR